MKIILKDVLKINGLEFCKYFVFTRNAKNFNFNVKFIIRKICGNYSFENFYVSNDLYKKFITQHIRLIYGLIEYQINHLKAKLSCPFNRDDYNGNII